MTRTQNSFFNILTGTGAKLLLILLSFITRTVFVRYLGTSYLGIEGLFSNILSMLSLADLGISYAIVFKLYKPIEENNRPRILALMHLYRQTYRIIGAVIFVAGLCLIPFLPTLVRDYERFSSLGLNAVLVFLIFLANTSSSYWIYAYKASFVRANQKSYILTTISYITSIVSSVLQIVALAVFRSFMLYILVQLFITIVNGLIGGYVCDRRYPFVNEKTDERVSRAELKDFIKDCSALMVYKVHNVLINSSDNIVLSVIYGLDTVGLYANYLILKNSLRSILDSVTYALQASLGSIYSTGKVEWSRLMFRTVNLITCWLYGVGAIGLAVLINEFIPLWLGSTKFVVASWTFRGTVLTTPLALALGVEMFIIGYRQLFGIFREAMGLFQYYKFRPLLSVAVNLAVCIPGVYFLGPIGCVISTVVAGLTTNMIFDPIIIHRYALDQPVMPFFARNGLYAVVTVAAGLAAWWICGLVPVAGVVGFLLRGCLCDLIPSAVYTLCFFRTTEFRFLLKTALSLVKKSDA
jgi:O-antigen/teichoic acid export membrane protein